MPPGHSAALGRVRDRVFGEHRIETASDARMKRQLVVYARPVLPGLRHEPARSEAKGCARKDSNRSRPRQRSCRDGGGLRSAGGRLRPGLRSKPQPEAKRSGAPGRTRTSGPQVRSLSGAVRKSETTTRSWPACRWDRDESRRAFVPTGSVLFRDEVRGHSTPAAHGREVESRDARSRRPTTGSSSR
jgi:hypothetical protein